MSMKKFLLGLMAFLAMAVCFTACGDDDSEESTSAETSGKSLYDSYQSFSAADASTTEGQVAKLSAAASLYESYQDFQENKGTDGWVKEFATGAVYALAEDKKETAKESLISTLTEQGIVDETTTNKIEAVSTLAQALGDIF